MSPATATWADLWVLAAGDTPWEMAVTALGVIAMALGGAVAAVPGLRRWAAPPLVQSRLTDLVQIESLLADGRTIRCRNGTVATAIEVAGLDVAGTDVGERFARRARRKVMFTQLSGLDVHARVFDHKERVPAETRAHSGRSGAGPGRALRRKLVERWESQFAYSYRLRHVIALSAEGNSDHARARLEKAREVVLRELHDFGARDLVRKGATAWWGRLLSPASRPAPAAAMDLASRLATDRVTVDTGTGLLSWSHGTRRVCAQVVGVSAWGRQTGESIPAQIMALDGEVLIVHQARVMSDLGTAASLKHIERGAVSVWVSDQAREELTTVVEMTQPNSAERERLVRYSMTVFAFGASGEEAGELARKVEDVFRRHDCETVVEGDIAGLMWWAAQPGWEEWAFVREIKPVAQNVADLVPFDSPRDGLKRCAWGDGCALRARTATGSPYWVNFHESAGRDALGHVAAFGRTGSGKTTTVDLLTLGALEHFDGLMAAGFDSRFGTFVSTALCGGRYIALLSDAGAGTEAAQLQPLQRTLSLANRAHIVRLFRRLTGLSDPESERGYELAVRTLARMEEAGEPCDRRTLKEIADAAFDPGSAARRQLEKWLPGGTFGSVFAGQDHVPLDGTDLLAFDFTTALADPILAPPLVEDVAHLVAERIRAGGRGGILKIDETAQLWSNEEFLARGVEWLQQARKDLVAVVTMWQRPSALAEVHPNLPQIIRSQTATWLFHRDRGAKRADFGDWLTDEEFAFVSGADGSYDHMHHPVLLKKPNGGETAVLEFSTHALGELACAFSSDRRRVERARVLQGWDPVGWRDIFVEEFGGWA